MVVYHKIQIDIAAFFRLVHTATKQKNITLLKKQSKILFDDIHILFRQTHRNPFLAHRVKDIIPYPDG